MTPDYNALKADYDRLVKAAQSVLDLFAGNPMDLTSKQIERLRLLVEALPRPRKLAPEWKELREDSWEGMRRIWLREGDRVIHGNTKANMICDAGYTHWAPCDEPRVWEDEA